MDNLEYRTRYAKETIAVTQQGASSMRVGSEGIVEIKETATFTHEGGMVDIEDNGRMKRLVRWFLGSEIKFKTKTMTVIPPRKKHPRESKEYITYKHNRNK